MGNILFLSFLSIPYSESNFFPMFPTMKCTVTKFYNSYRSEHIETNVFTKYSMNKCMYLICDRCPFPNFSVKSLMKTMARRQLSCRNIFETLCNVRFQHIFNALVSMYAQLR